MNPYSIRRWKQFAEVNKNKTEVIIKKQYRNLYWELIKLNESCQ